jgi:hypothetical protein
LLSVTDRRKTMLTMLVITMVVTAISKMKKEDEEIVAE